MSDTRPLRMLVVDDDPGSSGLLREVLRGEGYDVTLASRGAEALRLCEERPFDIVVSDVRMPDIDGLEVLRRLKAIAPRLTIILVSAFGTVETAVAALQEGAFDYVLKPFNLEEVRSCVRRAAERHRIEELPSAGRSAAGEGRRPQDVIGSSPAMVELFKLVSRVAGTKSSVLIQGESGTGKELIARTIHSSSPRRGRPFVAVNCTSLSETLLESELFGHVKGAFTGATERRPGLFLEANRSTVFLDEVGDMSLSMQAKLLRVLQEQEVKPVGGTETIPVDVRVVAATNRDLEALVSTGRFREDLFYRLHVITFRVPPLRERREEIAPLANHFLRIYSAQAVRPVQGFTPQAMAALVAYSWPGNVRELENVVDRAVALATGRLVEESDLPETLLIGARFANHRPVGRPIAGRSDPRPTLEEITNRYVRQVLQEVSGNKTQAARILGVPRRTLYRILARMEPAEGRTAPSHNITHVTN